MNTASWKKFAALASLLLAGARAGAEDIDLFLGQPAITAGVPNVLFVLDNTGNWSSPFTDEKAALVSIFDNLPVNADGSAKFNVGLMLFTETGSGDSNIDGGYVRAAIRPMTTTNRALYADLIDAFDTLNDRSNSGKAGKTMAEAFYYFNSGTPYAGNNKNKTDYTGNVFVNAVQEPQLAASRVVWALADNAMASKAATTYTGPDTSGCAKNFIIWISNGAAQDSNADSVAARDQLSAQGGDTTQIALNPSGSQTNLADEWARFMKHGAHGLDIATYTVDVNKVTTGQGPGWSEMLWSMATVSGGKYYDVSSASGGVEIAAAINQALTEIQAKNTVFASVSLPASTNTQSTFLNQVYIGMFRPDANAYPRWYGNLKQYRLGLVSGEVKLLDAGTADNLLTTDAGANPLQAISATTGFITDCARSFWTPTSTDSYWSFSPSGECTTVSGSPNSNYPDGPIVEKGAQGYKLRALAPSSRTVYTCSPTQSACTTLTNFADANTAITDTLLNVSGATARTAMINWARGTDLDDENGDGNATAMRASVHGDVVHSRPVAINYGTDASPQVVVFYSANDGLLRAINGNRATNIGSVTPGSAFWSFVAPEFYSQFERLRSNSTQVSFPGVVGLPKPYGIDGQITAFSGRVVQSGTVYSKKFIFAAMRRGGRSMYAFDVTTPASPTLKWKRGCPNQANDTDCNNDATVGDWSGIGQTWSPATAFTAEYYSDTVAGSTIYKPLLIMGGGYDTCEDTDGLAAGAANHSCDYSSAGYPDRGNRIYILDGDTGNLIRTFTTERGVTGSVIVVPDTATGLARYAYAADLGGNIYRIAGPANLLVPGAVTEIGNNVASTWTMTKIADLGCATPAACTANRKFLFGPDVAEVDGGMVIMIGSGDREKPLTYYAATYDVANKFFMVRDYPDYGTWLTSEAVNCAGSSVICLASLTPVSDVDTAPGAVNDKGWVLSLEAGTQVVTSSIIVADNVTFSAQKPKVSASICEANLGDAQVFNIDYMDAQGTREDIVGDGLPPPPVAGKVILDDGSITEFCIGCSPDSPLEGGLPPSTSSFSQPKSRVYWEIEQ